MTRFVAHFTSALFGLVLAGCATPGGFHAVAIARIPDGYTIKAVMRPVRARETCEEANRRFADSILSGCADCRIEVLRCERELAGEERALARSEPVTGYVLVTDDLRMLISGPEETARTACEQIAADASRLGVKSAVCRRPAVGRD